MKRKVLILFGSAVIAAAAAEAPTIAKIYDGNLSIAESEIVPLAEAMPADKYDFAPTDGAFKGVRTFGQQVKHMASTIYGLSASIAEQKPPADVGGEDGPASVKTKDDIVKYLKDAFAYSHKVMQSMTPENQLRMVKFPFGGEQPRGAIAELVVWHCFDHYGQMVVYARMNGVIPPASQPRPPAAKK